MLKTLCEDEEMCEDVRISVHLFICLSRSYLKIHQNNSKSDYSSTIGLQQGCFETTNSINPGATRKSPGSSEMCR